MSQSEIAALLPELREYEIRLNSLISSFRIGPEWGIGSMVTSWPALDFKLPSDDLMFSLIIWQTATRVEFSELGQCIYLKFIQPSSSLT